MKGWTERRDGLRQKSCTRWSWLHRVLPSPALHPGITRAMTSIGNRRCFVRNLELSTLRVTGDSPQPHLRRSVSTQLNVHLWRRKDGIVDDGDRANRGRCQQREHGERDERDTSAPWPQNLLGAFFSPGRCSASGGIPRFEGQSIHPIARGPRRDGGRSGL